MHSNRFVSIGKVLKTGFETGKQRIIGKTYIEVFPTDSLSNKTGKTISV